MGRHVSRFMGLARTFTGPDQFLVALKFWRTRTQLKVSRLRLKTQVLASIGARIAVMANHSYIILRRPCRAGIDSRLAEDFRMDGVKRYDCSGAMCQSEDGDWVCVELLQSAQSELAALREELASVKGLDHNQLLAESAAQHLIKRGAENYTGEVFTIQLDDSTTKFEVVVSTQKVGAITVYERLTAAEQRNAELVEILRSLRLNASPRLFSPGQLALVDAALKPTESGAINEALEVEGITQKSESKSASVCSSTSDLPNGIFVGHEKLDPISTLETFKEIIKSGDIQGSLDFVADLIGRVTTESGASE